MTLRINSGARDSRATHFGSLFDGGVLEIRSGDQPISADSAASGTLLCTITLPDPAFDPPVSGTINKAGTWTNDPAADGDAGWGRLRSSDDTIRLDGSIGLADSDADILIDNVAVKVGSPVTVLSCALTEPASEV